MPINLKLDSNKVYHKRFEGTKPGYDALQVDTFLDIVIKDYEAVESYVNETDKQIEDLKAKVKMLNDSLTQSEAKAALLQAKLGEIQDNEDINLNNLELMKRIAKLEKALQQAGINPKMLK